jgi:hypothetical protein
MANTEKPTLEKHQAALKRIDQVTTTISTRLRVLADELRSAGLQKEHEDRVLMQLEGFASSLEQMAKSPDNPVPQEPEPLPPPPLA